MLKRKLGNTGPQISALGIGALSFGGFHGPMSTKEVHGLLKTALDLGIDHIDTSNVYGAGTSEERIGSFLAEQGAGRNSLFKIASKASIRRVKGGGNVFDNSPEHLTEELDKSLKRLGVEAIDLYYIHRRDQSYEIESVVETLVSFVKQGKIKQIGFSEISPSSLARAAAIHPIAAVQSEYSLSTRSPEMGLVQKTKEVGAALVAHCPVGRSLLTDTPYSRKKVETMAFLASNPRFIEPNLSQNIAISNGFRELAADMGVASASLAIAWILHQGSHIIPIPGTRSIEHLRELAQGTIIKLSTSDLAAIDQRLPLDWAHGDRYSAAQWVGAEKY